MTLAYKQVMCIVRLLVARRLCIGRVVRKHAGPQNFRLWKTQLPLIVVTRPVQNRGLRLCMLTRHCVRPRQCLLLAVLHSPVNVNLTLGRLLVLRTPLLLGLKPVLT